MSYFDDFRLLKFESERACVSAWSTNSTEPSVEKKKIMKNYDENFVKYLSSHSADHFIILN